MTIDKHDEDDASDHQTKKEYTEPISPSHDSVDFAEEHEDLERGSRQNSTAIAVPGQRIENAPALTRTVSSTSSKASVRIVPRAQRVGLLGRFCVLYQAENPYRYPRKAKWLITFWIGMAATVAPVGSAIILPALPLIIEDFQTKALIANLTVALYMLAMSLFPLWWSSFSETAGRRTIYVLAFLLFTVFNAIAAVSTSIGMLIALRLLAGGTSAAVQAVGAGTVADIWEVHERGRAMGIFYLGPLCGPLIAPLVGGGLTEGFHTWRSTQWFQVIFGGIILLGLILFVPETHKKSKILAEAEKEALEKEAAEQMNSTRPALSRVSSVHSAKVKTRKWLSVLHRIFVDPLKIVLYLRYPAVALVVYYASIAFGALYFLNISVEKTFSEPPYNFSPIAVGCLYMFNSTGYLITAILGGKWVDRIMHREARKAGRIDERGKLKFIPEDRVRENAWTGALVMPAALIWYAWTADQKVYFLAPMAANFCFGASSMLIFGMATTMLTEFMPKNSSNGVALNNFVRNIFAFIGVFAAEPAINGIGNGWLFTILGLIAFASCLVIVAMRRYGEKWREEMDRTMDQG